MNDCTLFPMCESLTYSLTYSLTISLLFSISNEGTVLIPDEFSYQYSASTPVQPYNNFDYAIELGASVPNENLLSAYVTVQYPLSGDTAHAWVGSLEWNQISIPKHTGRYWQQSLCL